MSKQVSKGGKIPLSEKQEQETTSYYDEFDNSLLAVDPALKREIEGKGLVCRWINATKFRHDGNYHQSGWRPYKKQVTEEERGSLDFQYGVSPEGFLIRGDNLLAVKPAEVQARWRANIRRKAQINAGKDATNIEEFKERAARAGAKSLVGYDEND